MQTAELQVNRHVTIVKLMDVIHSIWSLHVTNDDRFYETCNNIGIYCLKI